MKIPSLGTIGRLYEQETTLHFIKFTNKKLATLSRDISDLLSSLGDQKELSIWPNIITILKKIRFELATLPVSPTHLITDQLIEQLNKAVPFCQISFPDNLEQLSKIIMKLRSLQGQENQFLDWIEKEPRNRHDNDCLCILHSKYVELIENIIHTNERLSNLNLKITSPRVLKDFTFYRRIFFCGSVSLFTENQFRNFEYVWRSPRAPDLYFLSYEWIGDDFEPKPAFDVEPNKTAVGIVKKNVANISSTDETCILVGEKNRIDIGDIDFSPVELVQPGSWTGSRHYELICDSKLLVLEDGTVIYKEINSSSRIVELDQQIEIHKIANRKLESGMLLVVRTEGSGDSIAAVADMLMGESANQIRRMQEQWKDFFRKKLNSYDSIYQVAKVLIKLGAPTANEINVRNWQRHDTIKPKNKDDFKAIMFFAELPDMIDKYWKNAQQIDQMHKNAGREISKLLLSRINESSMADLEKYGRIDIEINGLAGKVSVIGIESIMPDIYNVPSSQLDKVVNIGRGI